MSPYPMMLPGVLAEAGKFEEAFVYGEQAVAIFTPNHGGRDSFVVSRKLDIQRMRAGDTRP